MMTFLLRLRKGDLLEVARELGVEVNRDQTKVEIKDMILQSDKNDMETIKAVMEGILEEKEREFEERRQTREYELERLRLSNATETVSVSSADLEGQGVNRRVNLKDLGPKFDEKNADINLFFEIFVRQAKKEKVSDDRFQVTPVALRDRFESHQRRPGTLWSDLVFDLMSYLDNWLAGMEIKELKELLVTEQLKRRAPIEVVDHFIDSWDNIKDPTELAEKLDHFEAVRKVHRKQNTMKLSERKQFDRQPVVANKGNHLSEKNKLVNVLNKEFFRNSEFQGTSQIRSSEMEWERLFER
ncbi:uncharacterized protein TNCV_2039571 [Trichonephila clavipes]|nr:uncharacterized protein TNCV_2039571 [Trichonephila clavipes]